ncbi:MAG: hypothetical protein M1821_007121 [Bathelium mastoideum]|nr:MAG: hypothetical protein M1821_007121 [Bathelium mastoideum]KAI9694631.1 MAG: hypothetical protein M1822_000247 [Bathelium mastoideum]
MASSDPQAHNNADFELGNLFNVKGKVALVTGGGSGIGLMATQALAVNGAKVYIVGRTEEKLERVAETYGKNIAGEIIPLSADITSKDAIRGLVAELEKREHCLCMLVNNAGIAGATHKPEGDTAEEVRANIFDPENQDFSMWEDVYRTNVGQIYFLSTALLPLLQRSTERHPSWSGTILNITSISGTVKRSQNHFAYNASKAAALHLTKLLANELWMAGLKIRVNSVAPGVFPSEMTAGGESGENQKSELPKEKYAQIPAGRPGNDRDMGSAILFALSNQYFNGQNVIVDGGYLIANGA